MFNKIKNLFKNSKIANLEKCIEELRNENDARAQEIYSLKKALQECQDNQSTSNEYDIEEMQNNIDDLQDTLDNMPDLDDLAERVGDLETKCDCIYDYFDPDDKADVGDIDDLDKKISKLDEHYDEIARDLAELKDGSLINDNIVKLQNIKSELKAMFEKIVDALED